MHISNHLFAVYLIGIGFLMPQFDFNLGFLSWPPQQPETTTSVDVQTQVHAISHTGGNESPSTTAVSTGDATSEASVTTVMNSSEPAEHVHVISASPGGSAESVISTHSRTLAPRLPSRDFRQRDRLRHDVARLFDGL